MIGEKKYAQVFEKMNLSFDDYFVTLCKYDKGALIKKNKGSEIYQITSKETGNIYAAKKINQDINIYSKFEKTNIPKSLYIMSKLNHPSILKLLGISPFDFKNKPKAVIVTEICSKGSLNDLLQIERKRPNQNGHQEMMLRVVFNVLLSEKLLQQFTHFQTVIIVMILS